MNRITIEEKNKYISENDKYNLYTSDIPPNKSKSDKIAIVLTKTCILFSKKQIYQTNKKNTDELYNLNIESNYTYLVRYIKMAFLIKKRQEQNYNL